MAADQDFQTILNTIEAAIRPSMGEGEVASYIPQLAEVDPHQFGMALCTVDGETYTVGQADTPFSIQSISKAFTLTLAIRLEGEKLWRRVGKEPSGSAFNSLVQLEYESGIPRNPFINAGALLSAFTAHDGRILELALMRLTTVVGTFWVMPTR